jgi:glutamyl-tRNA reductase
MVKAALDLRRTRPIFFIDMGVPRNVDPRVEALDNAYVYDMDDLQGVADANAGERRRESDQGEEIVGQEQLQFDNWLSALKAVPTIRHLRARAEMIRTKELERLSGRLALDPEQREAVEALTRGIVNKLLHAPLAHLRNETDSEAGRGTLELARTLFALDDEAAPGAEADAELHREIERSRLLAADRPERGVAGGDLEPGDREDDQREDDQNAEIDRTDEEGK